MTVKDDKGPLLVIADIPAALGLLSRLPVRIDFDAAQSRDPKAAWAYPVAGGLLALIAASLAQIALFAGLPNPIVAALALACMAITTGAMHEDGLADSADGLWGGWDKAQRLDIMKDSHIGTYGVIALILSLLLRWQALTVIIDAGALWPALIATAMISRAVMVPVMSMLPHARNAGLSHRVGQPPQSAALAAIAVATLATLMLLHGASLAVLVIAAFTAIACARIAQAKIGGQTGDILGATQQITDIAALTTLAALLT